MRDTLDWVRDCIAVGQVRISRHGSDELDNDAITLDDVLDSAAEAEIAEDYASGNRGPSVLALHRLSDGRPAHVVWAFRKGTTSPAVLVTAYRPDPSRWSSDFKRRQP
jgi:hypothetical protein